MLNVRQIEDTLRQEYYNLLPVMKKLSHLLDAEVRWRLKSLVYTLRNYQRIEFESRIKDCESAIDALRRRKRKEGTNDFDNSQQCSLIDLKDLVGMRVLVFPVNIIDSVNEIISSEFKDWQTDHERHGKTGFFKYYSVFGNDKNIKCEVQIVSLLTGKFWEVEHSALYKPHPEYKGIEKNFTMTRLSEEIRDKLTEFSLAYEKIIQGGDISSKN